MLTKNEILKTLKEKKDFLSTIGVKQIGLFGSYSNNLQNKESDIDILVDFYPENETFDNFMKLYDILENTFSKNKVEIVTKNGLSKHIGSHILNETIYV